MKIFLCGYMGSGKSVVAKRLAEKLKLPLIDIDDQIALIENKSVPEIFKSKGELFFRKRENQVLQDVMEDSASLLISLGGGTPCYANNLEMILNGKDSILIYLKASVEFLTQRLSSEKDTRPVISHLKTDEDLEDFIRKHLFERSYYYNQANWKIPVEDRDIDSIVDEILENLK
jgi:shikimate kinase